jgi:TatD DNase family protein
MIDTHAHLCASAFDKDRDVVIERALGLLSHVIEVGITPDGCAAGVALAEAHPAIVAAVGIHPHEAGRHTPEDARALAPLMRSRHVVAVGETGLDFFRDYAPHDHQEALFREHIEMAREAGLPLILHSRGAEARVLDILEETNAGEMGGVMHCYGGGPELVPRVVEAGFHLGFGGSITRNRKAFVEVVPLVPRERVLFETDCPYLAPSPGRNRRNEPAFVVEVLAPMAELRGEDAGELEAAADANARRLFNLS